MMKRIGLTMKPGFSAIWKMPLRAGDLGGA